MKALSIRQPWAWAILHAGKRIENRDWRACHYRGPFLIHASKGCTELEYASAAIWMHEQHLATPIDWRLDRQHPDTPKIQALSTLSRGGIVGICTLVDVILPGGVYASRCYPQDPAHRTESPWYTGSLGLVLDNVRPLPFVPFKGNLGLFDVPDDLVPGAFAALSGVPR